MTERALRALLDEFTASARPAAWRDEVETVLDTLVDEDVTTKFNGAALNLIRRFPSPAGSLAAKYDARWIEYFSARD